MKTELNFLELHHLVQELQSLVGARVDNIYQPECFLIQLHKSGAGKLFLRITDKVLWLSKSKPLAPESVTGLCGALRRHLEGKKLTKLEQLGSERIVLVTFETQKEKRYLYIELFSNGNLVLTDETQRILAAKEERAWKDREIRRGIEYVPPPAKANLFELKDLPKDEKSLAALGFGKLLAREIIARGDSKSLFKEKLGPRAYSDGELSPIKLVQYSEDGEKFLSFSELIDARLGAALVDDRQFRIRKSFEQKKAKLAEVIDLQSKNIDRMEKEALEMQRIGELIYEHYQEIKDVLDELNRAKARFSLQEIKAKLKGHVKIKDLNPKTSDFILEI
jgi:predicted ribosome quality control (RQC) complex YloA/Tae2 family protein